MHETLFSENITQITLTVEHMNTCENIKTSNTSVSQTTLPSM